MCVSTVNHCVVCSPELCCFPNVPPVHANFLSLLSSWDMGVMMSMTVTYGLRVRRQTIDDRALLHLVSYALEVILHT